MADIRQTNRTLVFEQFNPQELDLLTMIGDVRGMDSLTDEKIQEINHRLLVSSFQEFLDKFHPTVYSFYDANSQTVRHTLKKPEGLPESLITEIPLDMHNDFFKMVCTLVDTKRSMGLKNVDFKFETVLDQITPKKVMDDIHMVRKELQYTYAQYAELEDGDPKRRDIGDKLNLMMDEASTHYNNVLAMLPLAIEDCKARLLLGGGGGGDGKSEKIAAGLLQMGEDGKLKVLEAPKADEHALALADNSSNQGLIVAIEEDYGALNGDNSNDYVKALVVRSFCPLVSTSQADIDYENEVANHNSYLDFYTQAKGDFIKTVKPLIEKLLGVREFFSQYTIPKGKGMQPMLLISNVTPEMMAKSMSLPRLQTYLNTINNKNDFDNSIWFAVFPNLSLSKTDGVKVTRQRFEGNKKIEHTNVNSMETLAVLADTVHKYGVKTFFSFETIEETTFNRIATDGISPFINRCELLMDKEYSAFVSPCLPNITIIPKDKSGVVTGSYMVTDKDSVGISKAKEDIQRLWIEGVYISSGYIAAGIMAACQCPEYLKENFKKHVHPTMPGVRFDIEAGNNSMIATTTLSKEITGFTSSVKGEINTKSFGFIFASENAKYGGKVIDKLTVYKARSLAFDGIAFEPLYHTQVETYFDRIFRQATGDYKQDNITNFFSTNPTSQMSRWLSQRDYINSMIQPGDEIRCSMDEETGICDIEFIFGGSSRNMRINLQRSTANRVAV